MKKLLSVFLILFLLVGCNQQKQLKKVVINTKVIEQQQNGGEKKQGEKVEPVIPASNPSDVVGNSRLIVIDAGHQRYGNNDQEPIGPGAKETKAKVTSGATGAVTGRLESQINLEVAIKLKKN